MGICDPWLPAKQDLPGGLCQTLSEEFGLLQSSEYCQLRMGFCQVRPFPGRQAHDSLHRTGDWPTGYCRSWLVASIQYPQSRGFWQSTSSNQDLTINSVPLPSFTDGSSCFPLQSLVYFLFPRRATFLVPAEFTAVTSRNLSADVDARKINGLK